MLWRGTVALASSLNPANANAALVEEMRVVSPPSPTPLTTTPTNVKATGRIVASESFLSFYPFPLYLFPFFHVPVIIVLTNVYVSLLGGIRSDHTTSQGPDGEHPPTPTSWARIWNLRVSNPSQGTGY